MAFPKYKYFEFNPGDLSESIAGFSQNGSRATMVWLIGQNDTDPSYNTVITPTILQNVVTDILGQTTITDAKSATPALKRDPPAAHPVFQFLYANSISKVQGVGKPTKTDSPNKDTGLAGVLPFPAFSQYPLYAIHVEYTPRPYAVLPDDNVQVVSDTWTYDDGTDQSYTYASEWIRFVDYSQLAQNETITAQQGQMVFHIPGQGCTPLTTTTTTAGPSTTTTAGPTTTTTLPPDPIFTGMPKLFLPNQLIKLTWYQVPYRYLTSKKSFLNRWVGRVNQNDFNGWPAGSLLYLGANPRIYTPPIQQVTKYSSGNFNITTVDKLCDIEMTFLYTTRTVPFGQPSYLPTNANWIASGHNLQPYYKDMSFQYATSYNNLNRCDQSKWVPFWKSFPVELLFTDPDASQSADWYTQHPGIP